MYLLYKKKGETPLECIERLRFEKKIDSKIPLTYAGRLDPMAEGLLVCLSGQECKEKDKFTSLSKTYIFEILVGFSTDTYDILGLITNNMRKCHIIEDEFIEKLNLFLGTHIQKYPPYSSKTYKGKQLFEYARSKEILLTSPSHPVTIDKLIFIDKNFFSASDIRTYIHTYVSIVSGDFRQKEIIQKWDDYLSSSDEMYTIFKCEVQCSSGTYVRQLVNDIGTMLNVPCLTFSIKRTKIGEYTIDNIANI